MYQALYRKWRPKVFSEVVGQEHITDTLRRQVAEGHTAHAYLFTGTRGTGKTTCARILAKAVNCLSPVDGEPCGRCEACRAVDAGTPLDITELAAASNNGVHMLSTPAFNALLKILEEPPEHLMFILATTELHKVPATILSRCQRFSFKRILPRDMERQLLHIAQAEKIDLTADGAEILSRMAGGALRDALSLLDQCRVAEGQLTSRAVLDVLGLDPASEQWRGQAGIGAGASGAAAAEHSALDALVQAVLEERAAARAAKDWARADELRDRLAAAGVTVADGRDGATWSVG